MGSSRQQSGGTTNTTTQVIPTAEETQRNQLLLEQQRAVQPSETRNILSGLDLSNLLLTGQNLPGYLGPLPGGIDETTTQSMVNQSLRDITPGFQSSGLLDSGVRAAISARTAGEIRNQNAQFNLQNLQQLLNLAVGGQAVPFQAPISYSQQLGASLAGLRGTNQSSTTTGYTTSPNPFLQSFQTSLGKTLGSPFFSQSKGFGFGG